MALIQPGKWTVGALFNHLWSLSGANDRSDVNQTFLQPFANYNLGGGLSVGVSTEATGNWEADEVWTAPILFSVSKVTLLGKRPVSFSAAAGPTVSPDGGANWRFRPAGDVPLPAVGKSDAPSRRAPRANPLRPQQPNKAVEGPCLR